MAATKEEDRKGRLAIIIIKEKIKARAVQKQKEEECSFTVQQNRRKKLLTDIQVRTTAIAISPNTPLDYMYIIIKMRCMQYA